jgi:hypothetical protein
VLSLLWLYAGITVNLPRIAGAPVRAGATPFAPDARSPARRI